MVFSIPANSFYAMSVIVLVLIIAVGILCAKQHRNPQQDFTELRQRIVSWVWLIGILFFCLTFSRTTIIVLFGFISFLALKEFLSIVPMRLVDREVMLWAYLSIPLQYYWVAIGWYGMFIIFIPVYVFLFLPMRMVLTGENKGFIQSAGTIHWAVMLTVFCLSHIACLLMMKTVNPSAGNIGLIIFIVFMTQCNDVCQYLFGKLFGKHKIIPKVSPNKTWEGFLGGMAATTLCCGIISPFLTPLSLLEGFAIGMIISGAGFIGDVVISSVKRDLQIKDSGKLIPGHGGILDRFDSLIYTAPLFFHFVLYMTNNSVK